VTDALRDVLEANNASTQRILDQMCADKIDAKNEHIAALQQQLTMSQLAASQNAQTAAIIANNEAQTNALERYLAPVPIPAYIVQNPNCCQPNFGYGCNCA
jgi:outer membrane phospholipase A